MRKGVVCPLAAMAVVFGVALISHGTTLDDAKSLAEKAAAFVKANGAEGTDPYTLCGLFQ